MKSSNTAAVLMTLLMHILVPAVAAYTLWQDGYPVVSIVGTVGYLLFAVLVVLTDNPLSSIALFGLIFLIIVPGTICLHWYVIGWRILASVYAATWALLMFALTVYSIRNVRIEK